MKELDFTPAEKQTINSFEKQRLWFLRVVIASGVVGLVTPILLFCTNNGAAIRPNEIGDLIAGTAGPFWALSGVVLVYLAFVGQRVQLVYQQAELRATREEISQQSKELSAQRQQLENQYLEARRQTYENSFYQMLKLSNDIVSQLDIAGLGMASGTQVTGRDVFQELTKRIEHRYWEYFKAPVRNDLLGGDSMTGRNPAFQEIVGKGAAINESKLSEAEKCKVALDSFSAVYSGHQHDIGHYFRTLYHVVKFIDTADPEIVPDKQRYMSVVRAQLSSPELILLTYNGLIIGKSKFKPLMEKYAFLEHLPVDLLVGQVESQYDRSVFG